MTEVSPLAVRLTRLYIGSTGAMQPDTMERILKECSSDTLLKLRESSDEEIYAMFAGHYPRTEFYKKLNTPLQPKSSFRETYASYELRRVLKLMDPKGLFKDEARVLALDTVMPRNVRHAISGMHEDLLSICVNGESLAESKMVGEINNITITIDLPPAMDSYLEIVFAAVEECS